MTDVPAIAPPPEINEPPMPPQTAETPTSFGSSQASGGAYQRLSSLRQSMDERVKATSDTQIKLIWKVVNAIIGGLILLNGVARLFCISMSLQHFVLSLWLIIFGVVFILIELKLPKIDDVLKANMDFMYFPGFRTFFLTFVGTLQWWWWLGIVVSCFCFLGAIFNFYIMKTHPAFGHSSNLQDYEPPQTVPAHQAVPTNDAYSAPVSSFSDDSPVKL